MILCANPRESVRAHQEEIEEAIERVIHGSRYILGPELELLEKEFANYIGTRCSIGVANGTDAIELALRGLGIGRGDEVITVSHTAVATVAAIEAAGAVPVLVDVDPTTYSLNASYLESVISNNTKAVIAVHLYGQAADLGEIQRFCRQEKLELIEDVSQAHGARWGGQRLGSIGRVACFSCYPTKNLGALGDAGLIATNDLELGKRIRVMREYGWEERYVSSVPGRNSRLDELQAAILRIKLKYLDENNEKRRKIASFYSGELKSTSLILPQENSREIDHVFHLYVVKVKERKDLIKYLKELDIHPGIHYPVPIHLQPAYLSRIRCSDSMEITEELSRAVLSLPLYPELELSRAAEVVRAIKEYERDL
ncbi:MAG: DegT/DnrJ/EryC1/StrS family aminotransferase [Verrucomicrobiota bacterium]|nr:DegT/DnrJ/EryC1/StrS family aminotransferase [Verrucomicrobiota bacterium]